MVHGEEVGGAERHRLGLVAEYAVGLQVCGYGGSEINRGQDDG